MKMGLKCKKNSSIFSWPGRCGRCLAILMLAVVFAVGSLSLGGCGKQSVSGQQSGTDEETFKIVTSFYPLYIMVMNLTDGVPGVEINNMADPQTGCLHDYQLRPGDLVSVEGADIFLANGGGMEDFLSDVLETYPDLTIAYALDGVDEDALLAGDEHDHDHEDLTDDTDADGKRKGMASGEDTDSDDQINEVHDTLEEEDINPHTWLDPELYKQELVYISSILIEADSDHTQLYEENLVEYMTKINDLVAEYKELETAGDKKNCVLLHESFAYLANAYAFPVLETIDVEKDSGFSAKEIRTLIDEVKEVGTGIILSDSQYSGRISKLLSGETGMEAWQLDSSVSGDYDKDAWLNSMRKNLEVLKNASD